jgi:hypothetical protein
LVFRISFAGGLLVVDKLTMDEKLRIANSGGHFQEDGPGNWVGIKVRKGEKEGIIISDMNGPTRILTVRFGDSTEEKIVMNNLGPDPKYIHKFEWLSGDKWIRF